MKKANYTSATGLQFSYDKNDNIKKLISNKMTVVFNKPYPMNLTNKII